MIGFSVVQREEQKTMAKQECEKRVVFSCDMSMISATGKPVERRRRKAKGPSPRAAWQPVAKNE